VIKCTLACAAETAIENINGRSLTLVELMENIQSPVFPTVIARINAIFLFTRESDDPETFTPQFVATIDTQTIVDRNVDVVFAGNLRTRLIVTFQGFPIPNPGLLKFALRLNREELGSCDMTIVGMVSQNTSPSSS